MKIISCELLATAPVVSVRQPREERKFTNLENALNYFVTSRNIEVYSEITVLPERQKTDMQSGEVTTLSETVSYQIQRGFLNLTGNGSLFHKNNNVRTNIWYLNDEWKAILTEKWAAHLSLVLA